MSAIADVKKKPKASVSPPSPVAMLASADKAAANAAAALADALDQTATVQTKVEACAAELSEVNAVLSTPVSDSKPVPRIEEVRRRQHRKRIKDAIAQNEVVEEKVAECGEELAAINQTLSAVIDEREVLTTALDVAAVALAESHAAEAKAAHAALHDAITGLPNLTLFNDRLTNALAQAKRHQRMLAVMFIDLDAFKTVNDQHGHDAGDAVLRAIGDRLLLTVRAGDTVCRRSGDEFLILLPDLNNEAHSRKLAAKFRSSIAAASESVAGIPPVAASVGVALYPQHGRTSAALLVNADLAMYSAKKIEAGVAVFADTTPAHSAP